MTENNITFKTVAQLLERKHSFFIPSYQRGYRWTKQQVEDLLNDIEEFSPKEVKDSNDKTWYCLQPVVVKRREEKWEVIDGQQRLTTIYLILHFLNEGYAVNRKKELFELEYETRKDSGNYLKNKLGKVKEDNSNIDYFHISRAYQTIVSWFNKKGHSLDLKIFKSKFKHSTKVIWYETFDADSIDIFTRINMGKISLTNAELIKALFLNSSNFKNSEKVSLTQLEIAYEWDNIEYTLQDDALWYFVNINKNPLTTRIEFIFNLMYSAAQNNDLEVKERTKLKIASKEQIKERQKSHLTLFEKFGSDEYSTFRYFNDKFKTKSNDVIKDNWQEVKDYYQTIHEWFTDRELYHKIGFLVATGTEIKDILSTKREQTKIKFKESLNAKIKEKIKCDFDNLEYNKGPVRNILLLHNIQTMLNNTNETNRFPLDRYKKENWDVEHISATAEEMPKTERHQKDWLAEVSDFIEDGILKVKAKNYNKEDFDKLYIEILDYFSESQKHEDNNSISNLTLLDAGTNRSYKNVVFPVKRKTIINREVKGTFIPITTKNIFMKFYSKEVSQMTFWGNLDKIAYEADIKELLKEYLTIQAKTNNEQ